MRRGLASLEMDKPEEAIKGTYCNILIFHVNRMSICRQYMYNIVNLMFVLVVKLKF